MKKEKFRKWLPWIFILCFGIGGYLKLDASLGNANLLTALRTVGEIYGPEFDRITVHDIPYERVGASDLPKELRGADWYFVGYVTDGENSMCVRSPGKWDDAPHPNYLRAQWGYNGFTYQRVEN